MDRLCKGVLTFWSLTLFGITTLSQGCATPIEIKNASKAQLQLIDSVDHAVADLQKAIDQFHRDKQACILEEGRMLIARQAINSAVSNTKYKAGADELYETYTKKIQPWVDYAFSSSSIDTQINALQKRIADSSNPALTQALAADVEDLRLLQATLQQNKPPDVSQLEAIIQDDFDNERKTALQNRKMLEILRSQAAVMKAMHEKVDAWLTIDVTVTQQQADSLKQAVSSANQAIKGGGR